MKNNYQTWIRTHWRPMMAFVYMAIVIFDFMVGPIFWSLIQVIGSGSVGIQWVPLTLASGGVFHAAMGGVLGISAFTRGQEKIEEIRTTLNGTKINNNNDIGNDGDLIR